VAAWTYILECRDGSYYTGCTTALDQRYGQHRSGTFDGYTAARRPIRMVWSVECQTIHDAIALERQIKGWSRTKKQALIEGRFDVLPLLAKKRFKP
jgi:putative endonuclease